MHRTSKLAAKPTRSPLSPSSRPTDGITPGSGPGHMSDSIVIGLNDAIHDRVVNLLRPEPRGDALDLGAGDGSLTERLRREGFRIQAVDAVTHDFRPIDIGIKVSNLNDGIPFDDGSFDVVVSTEVIEHLENPWFFVRELHRVLRPGGVAVISTPNLDSVYVRAYFALTGRLYNFLDNAYRDIGHITPVHLWNMRRMAEDKFDIESVTVNASPVPKTPVRLPVHSRLFGQCIVVKMRRTSGDAAARRLWTDSRVLRTG